MPAHTYQITNAQGWIRVLCGLKLIQFLDPPLKKEHKITNTKLGTKVNIYLGPLLEALKLKIHHLHDKSTPAYASHSRREI